jgi:hypothetical protein
MYIIDMNHFHQKAKQNARQRIHGNLKELIFQFERTMLYETFHYDYQT